MIVKLLDDELRRQGRRTAEGVVHHDDVFDVKNDRAFAYRFCGAALHFDTSAIALCALYAHNEGAATLRVQKRSAVTPVEPALTPTTQRAGK
jgi:hypothetical protein